MLPLSDVIHLAVIGIAQGCAYGLIALGFVLIYKATEVVNFAHGEFMMLGAFTVLFFSESLGLGFGDMQCFAVRERPAWHQLLESVNDPSHFAPPFLVRLTRSNSLVSRVMA